MTMRTRSAAEALRVFSAAAVQAGLHPILEHQTADYRNPYVSRINLKDSVFCSPWWGHASGSQIGSLTDLSNCLAGAYGELIENVSCDLWYPDWLPCSREIQPSRDERRVSLEECVDSLPPKTGLRATMELASTEIIHRVHPYAGLTRSDTVVLFPREIGLEVVGRNNGAAVGSSHSEAIVAALLEIFERYVARKLCLRTETFPLIDPDVFQTGAVGAIVAQLKRAGLRAFFLDMTLGGRLPVLGLLTVHGSLGRMSVAIAGGDSPQRAIEHCLREMLCDDYYEASAFGLDAGKHPTEALRTWSRCGFTVGWGGSLEQVEFHKPYSSRFESAFQHGGTDADELLRWCLRLCQNFGADVYVRDCTRLGVPAVHAYAGHLSEYSFVAHDGVLSARDNARLLVDVSRDRWLHDYLPVLDRCTNGDFAATETLVALLDNPFMGSCDREDVCDYFSWPISTQLDSRLERSYRGVSLTVLLAGLRYHAGDFEQAAALWRRAAEINNPLTMSVVHLLELARQLHSLSQAKMQFETAFGARALREVERALALDNLLRVPLTPGNTEIETHWRQLRARIY